MAHALHGAHAHGRVGLDQLQRDVALTAGCHGELDTCDARAIIAGPGGGTSLNGTAMKAEAKALQEALLQDLKNYQDYSQPLTWVQG